MIKKILIRNYALIRESEISFFPGYTSVTGETGAGKSVLLGALGLLLGDRADLSAIPNKELKCVIEGEFEISNLGLSPIFDEKQWEYDSHTVLRREWLPTGKSRAFINDSPVQVHDLKLLGSYLLEIHSQHSALSITKPAEQLNALDIYAGNGQTLDECKSVYRLLNQRIREKSELEIQLSNLLKEREFNLFQLEEIKTFKPIENEESLLEQEIALLSAAEDVVGLCKKSGFLLTDSEQSVYHQLLEIKQSLKNLTGVSNDLNELGLRLDTIITEIKELSRDFESTGDKTNPNPERLIQLEDRYNKLQNLFRKHRLEESEQLIQLAKQFENFESTTTELETSIEKLDAEIQILRDSLQRIVMELRNRRNLVIDEFQERLRQDLISLEMPNVNIGISLTEIEASSHGADQLVFLFTANQGVEMQELQKCASGGELSRVNFCIRNLIAEKKSLPSLIYDEADTGVSGQVATRIGTLLKHQGKNQQILAITHLPQVAAAGENQLYVYKSNSLGYTETQTRYLNNEERKLEIAVMLSGNNPSDAAKAAAEDLLTTFRSI